MNDQPPNPVSRLDELAVERNRLAVERNELAIERSELANERTVLAYARTSIMAFLTGVSLFKLFPGSAAVKAMGWASIAVSVLLVSVGLLSFVRRYRSLSRARKFRSSGTI